MNGDKVYAFSYNWPESGVLILGSPVAKTTAATIDLMGGASKLKWESLKPTGVGITMPNVDPATTKAKWVYGFRLTGFE